MDRRVFDFDESYSEKLWTRYHAERKLEGFVQVIFRHA